VCDFCSYIYVCVIFIRMFVSVCDVCVCVCDVCVCDGYSHGCIKVSEDGNL
jgi:hypothetical protein